MWTAVTRRTRRRRQLLAKTRIVAQISKTILYTRKKNRRLKKELRTRDSKEDREKMEKLKTIEKEV
jgi:hypothetical protein